MALNNVGSPCKRVGQFEEAITAHQDAATIFGEAGDEHWERMALSNLEAARTAQNPECGS
jgi:hypothetical protein